MIESMTRVDRLLSRGDYQGIDWIAQIGANWNIKSFITLIRTLENKLY